MENTNLCPSQIIYKLYLVKAEMFIIVVSLEVALMHHIRKMSKAVLYSYKSILWSGLNVQIGNKGEKKHQMARQNYP